MTGGVWCCVAELSRNSSRARHQVVFWSLQLRAPSDRLLTIALVKSVCDESRPKLHPISLVRIADPGIGNEREVVGNHRRELLPGNDLDVL